MPRRGVRQLVIAAAFSALAALVWIVVAALTADRGFDTSDEGFYLLSYRWWDVNTRTYTGVQYLYGPVFEALGYNIAGLRLVRLFTVVAVHAVFAWSVMTWLRRRRKSAPATRLWEVAGAAAIIAAGGATYGWLPLSPGYNDVSLLAALLAAAVVLRTATAIDAGTRVPAWVPVVLGPVLVGSVFAKWVSSTLTIGVVGLAIVIILAPQGVRELLRFAGWTALGALGAVTLIHLLLMPLDTGLPQILAVNRLVARATNSPTSLLEMYWTTTVDIGKTIVKRHGLLVVAAAVAVFARRPLGQWIAAVLAVAGFVFAGWRLLANRGEIGGTTNLTRYPIGLLGAVAVAAAVGLMVLGARRFGGLPAPSLSREGRRGWAVLALLAVLPLAQAFGTGNPIYKMAVNGFAAWMAIVVVVLTGIETAPGVARAITAGVAAAGVALSSSVAATGLWAHPYRTVGHDRATAIAKGVPALASVRLSPAKAHAYSDLRRRLAPYLEPPGRAIMAFDEMAGIVLLLDGRPVGEAWYSALDPHRTAEDIRAVCQAGPWWGDRPPLLLFRRPVTDIEIDVLGSCGLHFATDYRLLAAREETMGLLVYVPRVEGPRDGP
jgi:hypothetical protein